MKWSIETEVVMRSLRAETLTKDAQLNSDEATWIRNSMENNYWEAQLKRQLKLAGGESDEFAASPRFPHRAGRPVTARSSRQSSAPIRSKLG